MPTPMPAHVYHPLYSLYLPTTIPYYLPVYYPFQTNPSISPFTHTTSDSVAQVNLVTSPAQQSDKAWYLDSGTTNHFTHGPPTCNHAQPIWAQVKFKFSMARFWI